MNDAGLRNPSVSALTPYYSDGSVTIYHGDCLETMESLPDGSVDLVFTSPPYNLGVTTGGGFANLSRNPNAKTGKWSGGSLAKGYGAHGDAMPPEEYIAWQHAVLRQCWRLLGPAGAIFYNHKPRVQAGIVQLPTELNPGLPLRQVIVWSRGSGFNFAPTHYLPTSEWILLIAKPAFSLKSKEASGWGDVWAVSPESGSDHPAPFPLGLPYRAIESTNAQVVLDPFAGSGTTLRAAKDLGRQAIGIEIEQRFCRMAVARLGQEVLALEDVS